MAKVSFTEQTNCSWFRNRSRVKALVEELFRKEKKKLEQLSVILCSDEFLLDMNRSFLKHDYYTDIITFDLGDGNGINGELYISIDRVVENAVELEVDRRDELHRVIFHGCLHLCGYKDKLNRDRVEMRSKEERYLRLYRKRST